MTTYGCPVWGDYRKTEEVCPGGTSAAGFHQVLKPTPFGGTDTLPPGTFYDSEGTVLASPIERDGVQYVTMQEPDFILVRSSDPDPFVLTVEIKNPDLETVTDGAGNTPWAVTYGEITSIEVPFSFGPVAFPNTPYTMEFYAGGTRMEAVVIICNLCE